MILLNERKTSVGLVMDLADFKAACQKPEATDRAPETAHFLHLGVAEQAHAGGKTDRDPITKKARTNFSCGPFWEREELQRA